MYEKLPLLLLLKSPKFTQYSHNWNEQNEHKEQRCPSTVRLIQSGWFTVVACTYRDSARLCYYFH